MISKGKNKKRGRRVFPFFDTVDRNVPCPDKAGRAGSRDTIENENTLPESPALWAGSFAIYN
jgi:hypothetical protein